VALVAPRDGIDEPQALRRLNGSSVYTVAGADLYTSQRILDAERRLVTAAGRRDGSAVDESAVELALLELAANGTALDAGQASLVRQMCTSGARVQLAIAPAGAGKTTAMRALALAWTQDGGHVIGLAPSAPLPLFLPSRPGSAPTPSPNSAGQ
jgi:AAA domain